MTRAFPHDERISRQRLVNGAETAIKDGGISGESITTQLSQLISVCQNAACAEEIENYIRYQIGRKKLERAFGEKVMEQAKKAIPAGGSPNPAAQVEAWARFATYLKREYVYRKAIEKDGAATDREAERPREGQRGHDNARNQQADRGRRR